MPNYPTHARWGRIGAVVAAVGVAAGLFYLTDSSLLAGGGAVGAAVATFVGAIFPDIDHHQSIPRKKASWAIRGLVIFGVASLAALNFELLVEAAEAVNGALVDEDIPPELVVAVGTVIGAFVAGALVDPAIGLVTRRHRGWTHSVPVMFVITAVLAGGAVFLTSGFAHRVAAGTVVLTFFFGCLIHLGLDGELV